MQRPRSPYDVLNVSPDAEPEVIEAAYRALMKKYHPDKSAGGPPVAKDMAAELNQAFKLLRDSGRRARYDAEEKARRPVIAGADWTFDGNRGGAPFTPRPTSQAQPAPPPPRPHKPPPRNRGRLIVGWIGIVLAAATVAVAALAPREPGGAARSVGATIRAAAEEVQDAAGGEASAASTPISERQIGEALVKFERVRALYGPVGVAAYSDACFDAQSRTRDLNDFDFCVAFDHAASALENSVADPFRAPALPRFTTSQLDSRHSGAAKLLPQDYEALEDRLANIRTLTYSAIAEQLDEPLPEVAAEPAPAEIAPAPPQARRQAPPRRPASRPRPQRRSQPAQPETDFLEREGGIY